METNLEYIGMSFDWQVYRNRDGYLEGYKGSGKDASTSPGINNKTNFKRLVTQVKTMEEFAELIANSKKKKTSYAPSNTDQPKLF